MLSTSRFRFYKQIFNPAHHFISPKFERYHGIDWNWEEWWRVSRTQKEWRLFFFGGIGSTVRIFFVSERESDRSRTFFNYFFAIFFHGDFFRPFFWHVRNRIIFFAFFYRTVTVFLSLVWFFRQFSPVFFRLFFLQGIGFFSPFFCETITVFPPGFFLAGPVFLAGFLYGRWKHLLFFK